MEIEAPSYQPVPLPRRGKPYLPSTMIKEKEEQECNQEQEQEQERNEEDKMVEEKGEEMMEAENGGEEPQHQIYDHDI